MTLRSIAARIRFLVAQTAELDPELLVLVKAHQAGPTLLAERSASFPRPRVRAKRGPRVNSGEVEVRVRRRTRRVDKVDREESRFQAGLI